MAEIKDSRDAEYKSLIVFSAGPNPTLAEVMAFAFRANMKMNNHNSYVSFEPDSSTGFERTRMECRELTF